MIRGHRFYCASINPGHQSNVRGISAGIASDISEAAN
jgi:hypothetical protein